MLHLGNLYMINECFYKANKVGTAILPYILCYVVLHFYYVCDCIL